MLNEVRHDRGCGRPAATTTRAAARCGDPVPGACWRMLQCSSASPAWRSPSRSWTFSAETRRSSWRVGTDGARSWRSRSRWRSFPRCSCSWCRRLPGSSTVGWALGCTAWPSEPSPGCSASSWPGRLAWDALGSGVIGGAGGRRHGRVGVARAIGPPVPVVPGGGERRLRGPVPAGQPYLRAPGRCDVRRRREGEGPAARRTGPGGRARRVPVDVAASAGWVDQRHAVPELRRVGRAVDLVPQRGQRVEDDIRLGADDPDGRAPATTTCPSWAIIRATTSRSSAPDIR